MPTELTAKLAKSGLANDKASRQVGISFTVPKTRPAMSMEETHIMIPLEANKSRAKSQRSDTLVNTQKTLFQVEQEMKNNLNKYARVPYASKQAFSLFIMSF